MESNPKEEFYDREIAPALLEIGKRCHAAGLSFVATVEYGPNETGTTAVMTKDASPSIAISYFAANGAPNFDRVCLNLRKWLTEKGVDHSASLFLNPPGERQFIREDARAKESNHA